MFKKGYIRVRSTRKERQYSSRGRSRGRSKDKEIVKRRYAICDRIYNRIVSRRVQEGRYIGEF